MDELDRLLEEILNIELRQIILSNTRDGAQGTKVRVRPVLLKEKLYFQETLYRGTQVFHENLSAEEMKKKIRRYLQELFRQGECKTDKLEAVILVSKKGKITVKVKRKDGSRDDRAQNAAGNDIEERSAEGKNVKGKTDGQAADRREELSHDRTKSYLLKDGEPVDFLVGLGVQTPEGKVTKGRYDKFRQINRYLEFIEDVLAELPKDRTIRVIDFGCGKSYLTFAMYYFLHERKGLDIEVTGLDLKADVIAHCNELAEELHYEHLHFEQGDINAYNGAEQADMVVSLHACDTATDYAIEKAVRWNAAVILAVPCCQHELNGQIRCEQLQPVLKYGLIRERMAALLTDALRANLLEQQGYDTQILEFIDMEHTPKNLLIRAVKRGDVKVRKKSEASDIREVTELLHVTPALEQLLK